MNSADIAPASASGSTDQITVTRAEELQLADSAWYHQHGYPYDVWAKLRREDPIHWVEPGQREGFWAVTRYDDIVRIQSDPEVFLNGPKMVLGAAPEPGRGEIRMIVNMDPPEHREHRNIVFKRFMPKSLEWVRPHTEAIVRETLDNAMARNGEVINFQRVLSNPVPTSVICAFMGVPREMWGPIIEWTEEIVNAEDPEVNKGRSANEVQLAAMQEMYAVYREMFEDRKRNPRDDLLTALLDARVDGKPLSDIDLYSWCFVLTTAGHETTQSSYAVGVHTLMEHPEQFAKLRAQPELLPQAIEEILRYKSPTVHFCRTPNRDVELHGKKIRAGETMVMFYPSGNRDEAAFLGADRFDIERKPNRHIAFGVGPHLCLGLHLARLQLRILYENFLRRVESIEPAGEVRRTYTINVGGYRYFPVRMRVRPD